METLETNLQRLLQGLKDFESEANEHLTPSVKRSTTVSPTAARAPGQTGAVPSSSSSSSSSSSYLGVDPRLKVVLDDGFRTDLDGLGIPDEDLFAVGARPSLPSNLERSELVSAGLQWLIELEMDLRQGHLNDLLDQLRTVLATRNVLLSTVVRDSKGVKEKTRSWREVNEYGKKRNMLARQYARSRDALKDLGAAESLLSRDYQEIRPDDLKINKDISEATRTGQKDDKLPWLWHFDSKVDLENASVAENECM